MLTIQFALGGIIALLAWQIWCFAAGFIFQDNEEAMQMATAPIPCLIGWLSWHVVIAIKKHYFHRKWVRIRLFRESNPLAVTDIYAPKDIAKNFNTDQSQSHYAIIMSCATIPYKHERYNENEPYTHGWDITPWLVN